MAKQVTKGEPLTKEEQAKLNKLYNSRQVKGDQLKPGELAEILDEHLEAFRKGDTSIPISYMGKKEKAVKIETPVTQKKKEVVKEQPKKEEPKRKPVTNPVQPLNRVEAKKSIPKQQDTRGYNKEGKQNVVAKTTEKLTGVQSLRRAAEIAANKALEKAGSGLRFKKALKDPVKGK